jgi:hypothetical protein
MLGSASASRHRSSFSGPLRIAARLLGCSVLAVASARSWNPCGLRSPVPLASAVVAAQKNQGETSLAQGAVSPLRLVEALMLREALLFAPHRWRKYRQCQWALISAGPRASNLYQLEGRRLRWVRAGGEVGGAAGRGSIRPFPRGTCGAFRLYEARFDE